MFSTSHCSTGKQLFLWASCQLNRSRRLSMSQTHQKSTASSTLSNATGSPITYYSGRVTVMYGIAGNLRGISGMPRNWSLSFAESIRWSLNGDWCWRSGIECLWGCYICYVWWISGLYKWWRHGFLPPTTGGGVSPCTKSAVRLLLGHWSVVGLVKLCGGIRIACKYWLIHWCIVGAMYHPA